MANVVHHGSERAIQCETIDFELRTVNRFMDQNNWLTYLPIVGPFFYCLTQYEMAREIEALPLLARKQNFCFEKAKDYSFQAIIISTITLMVFLVLATFMQTCTASLCLSKTFELLIGGYGAWVLISIFHYATYKWIK